MAQEESSTVEIKRLSHSLLLTQFGGRDQHSPDFIVTSKAPSLLDPSLLLSPYRRASPVLLEKSRNPNHKMQRGVQGAVS